MLLLLMLTDAAADAGDTAADAADGGAAVDIVK